MSVTLEVSRLSGWLNALANCRESNGGHTLRGEVRREAGGRRAIAVQAQRAGERARLQIGSRARGGAHVEHDGHGCDFGLVEAQRLVERRRILPRVERRAYRAGRGAAREAADDRGASSVQEGLDCRLGAGHGEERTENM